MPAYVDQKALDQFTRAIRTNDLVAQMRIITENLERSEGAEKAYWLVRRATCRAQITGNQDLVGPTKEDLDEAARLTPQSLGSLLSPYLHRAIALQQVAALGEIPRELRVRSRKEGYWHTFSFWNMVTGFHWLRRRWYQSFRAATKAMDHLTATPEEQRQRYEGWYYVFHCNRARAALRCGRAELAPEEVRKAEAMTPGRPHLHPWFLAMAKGELALQRGDYAEALGAINLCLARIAEVPSLRLVDTYQIELDLLAARIARGQGNQVGFDGFCAKALALCHDKHLPLSEAHVRAIISGESY